MLASTLGIEFDPKVFWDKRKSLRPASFCVRVKTTTVNECGARGS